MKTPGGETMLGLWIGAMVILLGVLLWMLFAFEDCREMGGSLTFCLLSVV